MPVLDDILISMVENRCSILYFIPGVSPTMVNAEGKMSLLGEHAIHPDQVLQLAKQLMGDMHFQQLQRNGMIDTKVSVPGVGQFEIHGFFRDGELSFSLRTVDVSVQ